MSKPTIVLVHGAFADASIWQRVYDHLAREGDTVLAPPNPLRGIPYDAAYTQSVIDQLDGPRDCAAGPGGPAVAWFEVSSHAQGGGFHAPKYSWL